MSQLDDLIEKYAADLREKCKVEPDMELLRKVAKGLGPSIYDANAALVAGTDPTELERVKTSFLVGKLGIDASDDLDGAIASTIETYGSSVRQKHRAVVYYLLTKHFGKEAAYG